MATFDSSGTNGTIGNDGAPGNLIADMARVPDYSNRAQGANCSIWGDEAPNNGAGGGNGGQGGQGNSGESGESGGHGGHASDILLHGEAMLGSFTVRARGGDGGKGGRGGRGGEGQRGQDGGNGQQGGSGEGCEPHGQDGPGGKGA